MQWFKSRKKSEASVTASVDNHPAFAPLPPIKREPPPPTLPPPYDAPPITLFPESTPERIGLKPILESPLFQVAGAQAMLPLAVGSDGTEPVLIPLEEIGHLLMAGAPPVVRDGLLHAALLSTVFAYGPNQVRLLFIDQDSTTQAGTLYAPIPHLLTPVVTDPQKAAMVLRWADRELNRRESLLATTHSKTLVQFNQLKPESERLYRILIALNELSGLFLSTNDPAFSVLDSLETLLTRGAAVGLHLLITTQLPETTTLDVAFPPTLKRWMPARVLWAGGWIPTTLLDGSSHHPWVYQPPNARALRPFDGVWIVPRDVAQVTDYFAPPRVATAATATALDTLTGVEFEATMQRVLQHRGWNVSLTKASGDFGADLLGTDPDGTTWAIQAKRWKDSVGIEAVQQVIGAQAYYRAQRALLMSTAPLTKAAQELAQHVGVTVWLREDILSWLADDRDRQKPEMPSGVSIQPNRFDNELDAEIGESDPEQDPLFLESIQLVVETGQASTPMLQRRMRIGYTRAARLIDAMEEQGYIGPQDGAPSREVYLTAEDYQQLLKS